MPQQNFTLETIKTDWIEYNNSYHNNNNNNDNDDYYNNNNNDNWIYSKISPIMWPQSTWWEKKKKKVKKEKKYVPGRNRKQPSRGVWVGVLLKPTKISFNMSKIQQ